MDPGDTNDVCVYSASHNDPSLYSVHTTSLGLSGFHVSKMSLFAFSRLAHGAVVSLPLIPIVKMSICRSFTLLTKRPQRGCYGLGWLPPCKQPCGKPGTRTLSMCTHCLRQTFTARCYRPGLPVCLNGSAQAGRVITLSVSALARLCLPIKAAPH